MTKLYALEVLTAIWKFVF